MVWPVGMVAVLAFLGLLKAYGLHPALSDENIYFYMATRVLDGRLPYADFSFAHPPVHLLLALPSAALGGNVLAFKMVPVVAVLVCTWAVGKVGRQLGGDVTGVLSALAFAVSHDVLRTSSHFTGATEATAFLALGWAFAASRPLLAGVMMGLGTGVALYVLPPAVGLVAGMAWLKQVDVKRVSLGMAASIGAWMVLGLALGGGHFWDDVFGYHFNKTESEGSFQSALTLVSFHQTPLLLAFVPAGLLAWKTGLKRDSKESQVLIPAAVGVVAVLVFLASQPRVFHFYFFPAFLLCAPALGMALSHLGRREVALQAALGLGITWVIHMGLYRQLPYAGKEWGTSHSYAWVDAPVPDVLNSVVKMVFWSGTRTVGSEYTGITYALWHESLDYNVAEQVASNVAVLTGPDETILGDSLAAPLAAIMSHRRLSQDRADTNTQRYKSGAERIEDVISGALQDHVAMLVVVRGQRFATIPQVRTWLAQDFTLASTHTDRNKGVVELWRRNVASSH